MKTTINSSKTSIFESAKRIIYSFQLLMIGIAIPVLFIIGISNINQKKVNENEINNVPTSTQLSPKEMLPLSIARI
ncbi:MAG: hypothetical protein ABI472_03865 [Ginsengibacter sp.]